MSDHRHDLDLSRAEAAARDFLAGEAAGASFSPLDPADLKPTRRRRGRPAAWLGAAACAAGVLVAISLALRPGGPIAATPEPTRPVELAWAEVAAPPLSPRFGALTAWLGDDFLVLGGWSGGPCPPGALCDMAPPDLRDGARYNPVTGQWRTVAALPAAFGRGYATSAAGLGAFYAVSHADDGSFWRYDPAANSWRRRTAPAPWGELVGSAESLFMVTGDQAPAGYRYDPAQDSWTALAAGPLDRCPDRQGFAAGQRLVVLAECGSPTGSGAGSDLRTASFDPATATWTEPAALGAAGQGEAVHTAGRLVWPDPLTPASSFRSPGIFDTTSATWREVAVDRSAGPLAYRGMVGSTGYLALDGLGLVAANGRLLDVTSGRWVEVPEPGVPERWDPVRVAGPASLLDCFGYEYTDQELQRGRFIEGCRLLGVAGQPDPTSRPAEPTEGPPGPAGAAWLVSEVDGPVPTDPLLVEARGRYYLMGGYLLNDSLDDVQLTDVRRFDPATAGWERLAQLPEAAVSRPYTLAADVVGELIYVHISFEESGELWVYDTVADAWTGRGPTDETEHYLGTEDGLVRFRLLGEGPGGPAPQLLLDDQWQDLPALPALPGHSASVVRLDDHRIGLVSGQRVAVLDTGARTWGDWSQAGQVEDMVVLGVDGAAVFVDGAADPERDATDSGRPEVAILRDGRWDYVPAPLATEAPAAGLTPATGATVGSLVVVKGRLLDTRSGEWVAVPALPGSDADWQTRYLAGGPAGVLTCYPARITAQEAAAIPACFFLPR